MKQFRRPMPLLLIIWTLLSCSETPTNTEPAIGENRLSQIPGCRSSGLAKGASEDSCFTYRFQDELVVDFCVTSNCCPDSNRFDLDYVIRLDTIAVSVVDTAAHLCRCLCPYLIHAEFYDLPLDQYVFVCNYGDSASYLEYVRR